MGTESYRGSWDAVGRVDESVGEGPTEVLRYRANCSRFDHRV